MGLLYAIRWKFHDPNFNRFWLIHPCGRQTERRTDGIAIAYSALSIYAVARKSYCLQNGRKLHKSWCHRPRLCLDVICKLKVSKKDVHSAWPSDRNSPSRWVIGLSQHPSAISSLIVADWPLHYMCILQNFTGFPPPWNFNDATCVIPPIVWTPLVTFGVSVSQKEHTWSTICHQNRVSESANHWLHCTVLSTIFLNFVELRVCSLCSIVRHAYNNWSNLRLSLGMRK